MKKIISWLDKNGEEVILTVLLGVMSCLTLLQIVMRYVFTNALAWPEEASRICLVWSAMLTAGYSIKKGRMLSLEVLSSFLSDKSKVVLDYFGKIVVMLLFGLLCYHSINVIRSAAAYRTVTTALRIPLQYIYLSCFVGFGLASIRQLQSIVLMFISKKDVKNNEGDTIA